MFKSTFWNLFRNQLKNVPFQCNGNDCRAEFKNDMTWYLTVSRKLVIYLFPNLWRSETGTALRISVPQWERQFFEDKGPENEGRKGPKSQRFVGYPVSVIQIDSWPFNMTIVIQNSACSVHAWRVLDLWNIIRNYTMKLSFNLSLLLFLVLVVSLLLGK